MRILVGVFILASSVGYSFAQDTKENAEFKLAVNLYHDKLHDLAAEQLRRFIERYPNTAQGMQARFYLGLTQMELNQHEQARIIFQNFALSYPENPQAPDAWWKVAEAYVAMRNFPEAGSAFERLKVFHPKNPRAPEALLNAGHYFRLAEAADRAKKTLRILIEEYPTSESVPEARFQLAETYADEGNFDRARRELRKVVERGRSNALIAKALLLTGQIYQREEKLENAEGSYREIVASYPNTRISHDASFQLGLLQQKTGRYLESVANFKKVLGDTTEGDPFLRQQALLAIGKSYYRLKDFLNSSTYLNELLQRNPRPDLASEARHIAAMAREEQKDYRGALTHYRAMISDTSNNLNRRRGFVGAARMSRALKDFQTAVSYLHDFINEFPIDSNVPAVLYTIGEIYENDLTGIGMEKNASVSYQTILSRHPRSRVVDDALFRFAHVQEKSREFDQAVKSYRELISRYPSSPHRQQAEERVRWITTFEPLPTSTSLSKLAHLLANLIATEARAESAFHLGEIYFNDLKDYEAAAKMFRTAIESKIGEPNRADAYYYRAKAYQFLTEKKRLLPDSALLAYEEFLKYYPTDSRSGEAVAQIALLRIAGRQPIDLLKAAEEFVTKHPGSPAGDIVVLVAGDSLMSRGNYDRAALAYQQVLSWFPTSAHAERALYRLGLATETRRMADSARSVFDSYLNRYPDGSHAAEIYSKLAHQALQSAKASEAISLYRKLIEGYYYTPQAEEAEYDLANAYLSAGQAEPALLQAEALLKRERDSFFGLDAAPQSLYLLARAYEQIGDKSAAKRNYLRYLQEGNTLFDRTTAAKVLSSLSRLYQEEGNLESAVTFLRQATEIGKDRQVQRDFADLLFEAGDYAGANAQYADLIGATSSNEERMQLELRSIVGSIRMGNLTEGEAKAKQFSNTYKVTDEQLGQIEFEKGIHYYGKREYTLALNSFQRLIKSYDKSISVPSAHYWIGKIYEATGQHQEALKKYEETLRKFPRAEVLPRVYLALGNASYRAEKFDTAVHYYRRVVEDRSTPPELLPFALNNLIEAYKTVGLFEAALQMTRMFVEKFPEDESVMDKQIDLGVLYEKLGYHDQSALHLQSLLEEAGPDLEAEIRYYIGEAFFGKGEYEQAILEFLKVPYLVTKKGQVDWTANAFYMSAQSYEKVGKYNEAIGMYKQIVDRPGIDQTFKAAAMKEIDRVNALIRQPARKSGD